MVNQFNNSLVQIVTNSNSEPLNIYPTLPIADLSDSPALYSSAQKNIPYETLVELRNKKLSYEQISRIVGCSKTNVFMRLSQCEADDETIEYFKSNRADFFAGMQHKLISSLTAADVQRMQPYQRVVATSILYDKERLERGQATSIIDSGINNMKIAELITKKDMLLGQLKSLNVNAVSTRTLSIGPTTEDVDK